MDEARAERQAEAAQLLHDLLAAALLPHAAGIEPLPVDGPTQEQRQLVIDMLKLTELSKKAAAVIMCGDMWPEPSVAT